MERVGRQRIDDMNRFVDGCKNASSDRRCMLSDGLAAGGIARRDAACQWLRVDHELHFGLVMVYQSPNAGDDKDSMVG